MKVSLDMEKDEQTKRFDNAIEFHKELDKKLGLESPNKSWHDFLVEYYNKKQEEAKNE